MSYYHFFTLKKDSKYNDKTVKELKDQKKRNVSPFNRNYKGLLKASMVRWYYDNEDDLSDRYNKIANYIWGIYYDTIENLDIDFAIEAKEDKDGIVRNRPMSEYDMHELIESWQDTMRDLISELLILSCIRFEADEEHSDVDKTTSEYLKYNYQSQIDEKLNYFEDECFDYAFAKFCTEECDRMTEDEKYNLEEELKNGSKNEGND